MYAATVHNHHPRIHPANTHTHTNTIPPIPTPFSPPPYRTNIVTETVTTAASCIAAAFPPRRAHETKVASVASDWGTGEVELIWGSQRPT
jgi:hypothetical protein